MGAGTASVGTFQKREPSGPPFVPTSADNGLSVDPVTGRIVLGNDDPGIAAGLLSAREIPLNGNGLTFSNIPGDFFMEIFTLGMRVHDAAFDQNTQMSKAALSIRDQIGGGPAVEFINGVGNLIEIKRLPGTQTLQVDNATVGPVFALLDLNFLNRQAHLGDFNFAFNGTFITVDDPGREIDITASDQFQHTDGANHFLISSPVNSRYALGDIDAFGNGTFLDIDDTAQTVTASRSFIATSTGNVDAVTANAEELNYHIWNKAHTQDTGSIGRDSGTGGIILSSNLAGITINPAVGQDSFFARGLVRFPGSTGNTLRWGANIAAPGTAVAGAVVNRYGGANNFLGDPTEWLLVNVNGTDRKIPCYAV